MGAVGADEAGYSDEGAADAPVRPGERSHPSDIPGGEEDFTFMPPRRMECII
jgi:hypothetical protein